MQILRNPRHFLLAITVFSYVSIYGLALAVGFKIDVRDSLQSIIGIALITASLSLLASRLQMQALRAVAECVGCGLLLIAPIALSTYLAIGTNLPLADAQLAAWDRMLGIEWVTLMRWIDERDLLSQFLNWAYRTFSYQLLLWPVVLILCNRVERAYQMVSAYAVLCLASSAMSILWPAVGTYTYYGFDADSLANIDRTYGYYFLDQFHAVRDNPNFVWRLAESVGILTFPSVHAGVAVLCAWAMWEVRFFRYPVLMINIGMAISAVPDANHYVVDVIMGCCVALYAVAFVVMMTRRRSAPVLHYARIDAR
ncbi:phosphatase PAP2 family protein [Aliirhizobium smilacinae]|uniref:Phosphatase PAP2 family protein n=1 Tax=Aliirhizobium smilacinae TaxID=1395944 RepID=A0A5C4XSS3_9HYPH|nr:phosphatase PAP2 family protein [Rhizobium smilacinae]TNM66227.1 phosphatase PAP2 family protein [Rhizobium smilacinae]